MENLEALACKVRLLKFACTALSSSSQMDQGTFVKLLKSWRGFGALQRFINATVPPQSKAAAPAVRSSSSEDAKHASPDAQEPLVVDDLPVAVMTDRKSTRLNSSHT